MDGLVGGHYQMLYENPIINDKDLLYSIGNDIQYLIITYDEKNLKKEYVYIELNHFTAYLKQTQHCQSTIVQEKKSFNM